MLLFCIIGAVPLLSAAYTWPNYIMDELEHLLVDGGGFNQGGVKSAITPCTNYVQGDQLLGRETAAQWQRVAFRSSKSKFSRFHSNIQPLSKMTFRRLTSQLALEE